MVPRFARSLGLILLLACGSGCAPQLDRIELGVRENTAQLTELRGDQERLRQEMSNIDALLRLDQDAGQITDAQKITKLSQLSAQLDQLVQKLDDNTEFMRRLSARVDLLASHAGVPDLDGSWPVSGNPRASELDVLPEEGRAIFQAAQLDRSRGNIEMARDGFQEFLGKYGDSEMADDALYWLGDLAYGAKGHAEALQHFEDLLARFGDSERAPAASLKAAYCLQALQRDRESRAHLQRLIAQYPQSPEATLAREMLK